MAVPQFHQFFAPLTHVKKQEGKDYVRLLLSWHGSKQKLLRLGAITTKHYKDIHSIWYPIRQLDLLLQQKELKQISFGRPLHPHLRVSSHLIGASQARLTHKLDGRGVIVGIIDTGIDYRHSAFRDSNGKTRLLALVDYSLPSKPKTTLAPPRIFLQKEIDQALATNRLLGHEDTTGHGTHIAGIAAGNRLLRSGKSSAYSGIAPRADLVVIKAQRAKRNDFISNDVVDGIVFIHQLAKRLKKPYVINLSLGGHQGGHDGSSLLEKTIDVFSGKGKKGQIIVASAGNEGNSQIHTDGWISPKQPSQLQLVLPKNPDPAKGQKALVLLELWLFRTASVKIKLISPQGIEFGPFGPSNWPIKPVENIAGSLLIRQDQPSTSTSKRLALLLTDARANPLQKGNWVLQLEGESPRFDAWITESKLSGGNAYFQNATQEMLIGTPGTAKGVITVGSFNSRSGWKSDGQNLVTSKLISGAISGFSSPGPTRDGRPKPELIAPGAFIAAAASGFVNGTLKMVADGPYQISQGTSQAAPHVTGTIALMLQKKPELDTESIRSILIRNSKTDQFTTQKVFHRKSGFGKLDLTTTLQSMVKPSKASIDLSQTTLGSLYISLPADGVSQTPLYIIPKDSTGLPTEKSTKITVISSQGRILGTPQKNSLGVYEVFLQSAPFATTAKVTAMLDGKKLPITLEIDFVSPPELQGCQCGSIQAQEKPSVDWFLFGLLFFCLSHLSHRFHCKKSNL